ncbi:phosphatase PAP2 family protein [Chitinophaga filiformis]|uniref:phosphatase PAP2 family protein n=1 Tax=Chitinophaga filiformis TaxID=104663 RepID=UPI001F45F518|nr:phosphatase PAP2 family protein [Chitinophaga filiformis]MCF6405866.1 phosphatase PAP2 family protein [Chitinophaga filiformis]
MRLFLLLSLQLLTYSAYAAADTTIAEINADTTSAANVMPTTATPVPVFNTNLNYKSSIPNYKARLVSIIVPTAMMTYGAVALSGGSLRSLDMSTRKEVMEDHPTFRTDVDDYLKWVPVAAVYALNMAGIHGKHNFADRTILLGMSGLITTGSTFAIKSATNRLRPDGSTYNSFPSGHTAIAFMSAQFMWEEYHEVSPWYGVAGYAVAAATGALRIYNNRHWVSDVVAGAGLGILSTKAAYWMYPKLQRLFIRNPEQTSTRVLLMPNYNAQWKSVGLSMMLMK